MNTELEALIDEAIRVELNVAKLYLLFYQQQEEDAPFWWELAMEEQNHAALLKTVKQMGNNGVEIPMQLFPEGMQEIRATNHKLEQAYEDFKDVSDRTSTLNFALQVETSAGELHYDTFMKEAPDSQITSIFRRLNGEDMDHARRIAEYMKELGIGFQNSGHS